eukprot:TRINITY_DN1202_c0_g3_i3.p1 TRINITY_DN1202_c0_g3~~TRINITY_DN1202_c0_g3_i3.p1  ORF type:complete len:385 (+),score=195.04 TRINITY_DN1202_c0_g3_i3:738-1892(+)
MNNIISIHPEDFDVVVQPGVTYDELNEFLKPYGLFFPMDPGPGACIGGMVGTSCSGTNAVRHGTMKENVISLKVVVADGSIVKTRSRAKKSSAGYDLTHLFIGSEGTLGVVTEITLKIKKRPIHSAVAAVTFPGLNEAAKTVIETIQSGVDIGRVELLDEVMIKAVNNYAELQLPEKTTLMFEFSSNSQSLINEQLEKVQEIAKNNQSGDFTFATNAEERDNLWYARKVALWAANSLRPGVDMMITDACVPISRLSEVLTITKEDLSKSTLYAPIVAHAGDGNFHLFILFKASDEKEYKEAHDINDRLVKLAIEMDGTCTGEHGVGFGKKDYLELELGSEAVNLMKTIKQGLDPLNIFNPGKILPSNSPHLSNSSNSSHSNCLH